jgi:hypothetical protein
MQISSVAVVCGQLRMLLPRCIDRRVTAAVQQLCFQESSTLPVSTSAVALIVGYTMAAAAAKNPYGHTCSCHQQHIAGVQQHTYAATSRKVCVLDRNLLLCAARCAAAAVGEGSAAAGIKWHEHLPPWPEELSA